MSYDVTICVRPRTRITLLASLNVYDSYENNIGRGWVHVQPQHPFTTISRNWLTTFPKDPKNRDNRGRIELLAWVIYTQVWINGKDERFYYRSVSQVYGYWLLRTIPKSHYVSMRVINNSIYVTDLGTTKPITDMIVI